VNLTCSKGSRTLLIGANGAGKSSLLRVVAGKHFHHPDKVRVFGRPAFHDTSLSLEVAHLGDRWGYESHGDVSVSELIASIEGSDRERCNMLMEVLEIEEHWKICRISDGQRRRVQLLLGLARPSKLLLLDEVTTDLDVVGRQNLLQFLKEESEQRGVTIIYATHIFDGLEHWASDIVYIKEGLCHVNEKVENVQELMELRANKCPAPLFRLVEAWLRAEFEKRQAEKKLNKGKKNDDPNNSAEILNRERTQNTGASRGALIPTPNFNASSDDAAKPKTAAQLEREEWAKKNNAHATVTSEGAFGVSSAPRQYPSKLGFNKTNPLPQN